MREIKHFGLHITLLSLQKREKQDFSFCSLLFIRKGRLHRTFSYVGVFFVVEKFNKLSSFPELYR
jgi:hypothetical protein